MSVLERELYDSGSAMIQLLRSCQAAVQRKLGQCRAQRSLCQVCALTSPLLCSTCFGKEHESTQQLLKCVASLVTQEEMEEGQKQVAAWDGELQELGGQGSETEGHGAELELQESMAAKEEEVGVVTVLHVYNITWETLPISDAGEVSSCADMQVRMLGAKLAAAEGLAQQKEAAAQQLSLARSKHELAMDALEKQRSLAVALEATTAAAGACTALCRGFTFSACMTMG